MSEPRILLVTGLWPTEDRPSAGVFVKRRVSGTSFVVVAPISYAGSMPLRYLRLAWRASTTRGRFDGVEAHPFFPAGLVGLLAARLRRVPLLTYAHGADVRNTAIANPLYRFLAKLVVRGSAAIATNSRATAELVERLGGKATVIPPGVDLERFRPSPRPSERRVLYLGGTDALKGYSVARELADTLVGPGLQTIAPDDVPALLAAHDVVLVPSLVEGFGLVAAEAIAAGRWVVATAVGGLADVVTDGVNGTLVYHGEYEAAIAGMPNYDPIAVAATASRFDIEAHRAGMASLWRDVLG